ncbi:MAG: NapC/NirT family cytochrome c [Acidobacteria bacterium]|nr:NapC/NirT family cytochrome c [Acidobacteriota bacterium]
MAQSNGASRGPSFLAWLRLLALPIVYFSQNTTSLLGVVLTTGAFFAIATCLLTGMYGFHANPYVSIVTYLILPGIFLLGLILIPVGILLKRRREARQGALLTLYPDIDFNQPELRRVFSFVALATMLNAFIFIYASYHGVQYMDSTNFCGQVCHTVMEPEYTANQNSPHARVECVRCHMGSGVSWFVRYKLSGVKQVLVVTQDNFPRPIPAPVQNLRPAQETCEQCHWRSKFVGSVLSVRRQFAADEANTASWTVLRLHVGGGSAQGWGIHSAHLDLAEEITYLATDRQRQQIPWVRYRSVGGEVREYATPDWKGDPSPEELRVMDCVDCHNRPAHAFQLPDQALDEALAAGRMDASLPFVKKKAKEILQQPASTQEAGAEAVGRSLMAYYRENYPQVWERQQESVKLAAQTVQGIYQRNVFPEMKVEWGTYPNNLGHVNFPGCYRCHDGNHTSKQGAALTQNCSTCHLLLAVEEENPAILKQLAGQE